MKKQLLLIDDSPEVGLLLEAVLKNSICELVCFQDPQEGLDFALAHNDLDLILLDIEMPHLSGLEILKTLHKVPRYKVPIFMITGHSEAEVIKEALTEGAENYILKPFHYDHLVQQLNELFRQDIFNPQEPLTPLLDSQIQALIPTVKTALLVSEEPVIHLLFETLFKRSIFKLSLAPTSQAAQDILKTEYFDLVIVDLPGQSGLDFLRAYRRDSENPVFMVSSDAEEDLFAQAQGLGISSYLLKPIQIALLCEHLEKHFGLQVFPRGRPLTSD